MASKECTKQDCPCLMNCTDGCRHEKALELLRNLVTHARPSFPKTPFRRALDEAKEFLEAQ